MENAINLKEQLDVALDNLQSLDDDVAEQKLIEISNMLDSLALADLGLTHSQRKLLWGANYLEELGPDEITDPLGGIVFNKEPSLEYWYANNVKVSNSAKTWSFTPKLYIKPKSLKGLYMGLKFVLEQNVSHIRPVGAHHSYSETTTTDGCVVDLSEAHPYRLKQHNTTVGKLDQSALKNLRVGVSAENHIDVPGGLTIKMLNHILCPDNGDLKHFGRKRLFNMGAGDVQSFAGAMANGTHGTMGQYSAYHDMVRSVLLVTIQNKVPKILRIEPYNGITNPEKHLLAQANANELAVELIQDDELFNSVLVSQGCMGIIFSTIVEITDMEELYEEFVYYKGGLEKFQTQLLSDIPKWQELGSVFQQSFQINPYDIKGKYSIGVKKITPKSVANAPIGHKKVTGRPIGPNWLKDKPFFVHFIATWLNKEIKGWNRHLIEVALKQLNDHRNEGGGYLDLAYKVWNAGTGKLKEVGTAIEYAFPAEQIVDVINQILKKVSSQEYIEKKLVLNGPIVIRFVWASPAYLGANYDEGARVGVSTGARKLWAYIEVTRITSKNPNDDLREKEIFKKLQILLENLGGRPHWGLNFGADTSNYSKMRTAFPKLELWLKALEKLSPDGVFDNKWVKVWREEWRKENEPNLPIEPLIE